MESKDYLKEFNLNEGQLSSLNTYMLLLQEWSKKMNLTSITEEKEVYIKHFYDSLLLSKFVKENEIVGDIGSGAGFPGIPLKIARESLHVDLIEPTTKRCLFLSEVIKTINLTNIEVINKRSEELPDKKDTFDVVTSRAVAALNILLELSIPLLKVNGRMYALKGSSFDEEIKEAQNAFKELNCKVTNIFEFDLPEDLGHRAIIEITKTKPTPKKYPRIYAKIKKQPL
ncbi:MAG: 16S rRNA (guanine(527)-N(7))-methyltransferase RsmG [Bacilli bacterium]|nr:16S rRNA (guanine(527)-N(7))-methyltransferase RsmG [Bacilli bacterium]